MNRVGTCAAFNIFIVSSHHLLHHQQLTKRKIMAEKQIRRDETVNKWLKTMDRYNPQNLEHLEKYVSDQASENHYDLEANLAILKMYQFNPSTFNGDIIVNILLKALTNLPHTDFIMCKCLIEMQQLSQCSAGLLVLKMHDMLERCLFKDFWSLINDNKEIWAHVVNFEQSIRNYIVGVVNITYQRVEKQFLVQILGFDSEGEPKFKSLMDTNGWKDDGDNVRVSNQDETIKTKNINEEIDFNSIAPLIAAYR